MTESNQINYSNSDTLLIGLISDTHIDSPNERLPSQVHGVFRGVDLILHAGDIWIPTVLDELENTAPTLAARGDDDRDIDIGDDHRIKEHQIITFEGYTIYLMHSKPHLRKLLTLTQDSASHPDIVVYGHNHRSGIERHNGTLLVNPGSPTVPRYIPRLGTVGLIHIKRGNIDTQIVQLE